MPDNPLLDVQTWLYHLGDVDAEGIEDIAAGAYDLVILEWASYASDETPYTTEQLETMRGGSDSLIVSYLSIGEAESYRYYWNTSNFQAVKDDFLDEENPEWEENFKVEYWNADWQATIFDYLERIIDGGFNGVYLDIIDAYEYWEEEAPNADINYRQEMADFVAAIRAHASTYLSELGDDREFVIIGQNGEALVENTTYLNAIDGIGKEDLQFYYENGNASDFSVQDEDTVQWSMDMLQIAIEAGKQVVVVEYVSDSLQSTYAETISNLSENLWNLGIPLYISENRDLDTVFSQPESVQYIRLETGSSSGETMRGSQYGDVIHAGAGPDQIWAGTDDISSDIFVGGSGNDVVGGGKGDDLLIGDEIAEGEIYQIFNFDGDTQNNGADTLYGGEGNDTLLGGSWDDALTTDNGRYDQGEAVLTDTGSNIIWAGSGNDVLIGASGNDILGGGAGNDTIEAGPGNDILYGGQNETSNTLNDILIGGAGNDSIYAATGDDSILGGEGNDVLFNGAGDDHIIAGQGDDTLWGGPGDDTLTGNNGSDIFSFYGTSGHDVIIDFDLADDILHIDTETSGLSDISSVQATSHETDIGNLSGLLITTGEDGSIFLAGLTVNSIQNIIIEFV